MGTVKSVVIVLLVLAALKNLPGLNTTVGKYL
jgi:hypothetical protein